MTSMLEDCHHDTPLLAVHFYSTRTFPYRLQSCMFLLMATHSKDAFGKTMVSWVVYFQTFKELGNGPDSPNPKDGVELYQTSVGGMFEYFQHCSLKNKTLLLILPLPWLHKIVHALKYLLIFLLISNVQLRETKNNKINKWRTFCFILVITVDYICKRIILKLIDE